MGSIIELDRSIIPACDVPFDLAETIVKETYGVEKIGGYKFGLATMGRVGYDRTVEMVRKYTDKPIIFDPQKWGTDIPDTAKSILTPVKESGIDAIILFPQSGPATQYAWTRTAQELGLGVIVGGEMTHPRYLSGDYSPGKELEKLFSDLEGKTWTNVFSELGFAMDVTGYLKEGAPDTMYRLAALMGVTNFVMPGNKPDRIEHYKALVESCGVKEPHIFSPGLVAQGGDISEGAKAAGKFFHGIVGSGIYKAEDKRAAALGLTSKL